VTVLILTQDRCVVCVERTIGKEIVWMHLMELVRESIMWNLVLVCLEIVLVSVQYRCTVCAKRTIGSEIVLNAPDETPM
jgi:uncharacterized membrane protein